MINVCRLLMKCYTCLLEIGAPGTRYTNLISAHGCISSIICIKDPPSIEAVLKGTRNRYIAVVFLCKIVFP